MILDLYKIKKLRNKFFDKRIFLIGNGPSVQLDDLEKLSSEITFCANRFHLCYNKTSFRPTLTFLEDEKMIENHYDEITLKCETSLYIPARFVINKKQYPNLIRYLYLDQECGHETKNFSQDLTLGSYSGASVVFGMFQVAAYMGAKEIILYGLDHNFVIPKRTHEDSRQMVIDSNEENHFISNYRSKNEVWYRPQTKKIEQSFSLAKKTLEKKEIKIINATRGGKLEIFKRKSFESIVNPSFLKRIFTKKEVRKNRKILIRITDLKSLNKNIISCLKYFLRNLIQNKNEITCNFLKKKLPLTIKNIDLITLEKITTNQSDASDNKKYDLVISFGNPSINLISHKASYFFMCANINSFVITTKKDLELKRNYDYIHALSYYDGILTQSEEIKQNLIDIGVKRNIYYLPLLSIN